MISWAELSQMNLTTSIDSGLASEKVMISND